MREKQIEHFLKSEIEKLGGVCWKWVSPGMRGVPDRICILPGGRIYFVELKQPKGKLSKLQRYVLNTLERLGCKIFCLTSLPSVVKMIADLKEEGYHG